MKRPSYFDLRTIRRAGRSRVRAGLEIVDHLSSLREIRPGELEGCAQLRGASAQYIIQTASPAALGAVATVIGPLVGLDQSPLVLGLAYYPTVTGANAAAVLTFAMRRTDTPAVIGQQLFTTATGDTNPRGPFVVAVVPFGIPAAYGIDLQGTAGAGAGTLTCSATAPGILAAIGLQ